MTPAYLLGKINGENVSSLSADAILITADVVYELNAHSTCKLVYRQSPDNRFPIEDWIGRELKVVAVDAGGVELTLFLGVASTIDLHYELSGSYNLVIEGVSNSMRMDLRPALRSHEPKNLRGHLQELVERFGLHLVADFENTGPRRTEGGLLQVGETDFGFFHRLVDRYGLAFRATQDGLQVIENFIDAGCSVDWRRESGLLDFRLIGRMGPTHFDGAVYDRSQSTSYVLDSLSIPGKFGPAADLIEQSLSYSGNNHWSGFLDTPFLSRSEQGLRDELELESRRSAVTRTFAAGESREASIRAGQKLTINGNVDFAGGWGVVKVVHHWRQDGYKNEFIASPFTGPLGWNRPANTRWPGLMAARVVDLGGDNLQGRVKIQFPWESGTPWLWARFMSPYAGQNRGIYFSPEVGDEVMISFEYGDTNRPIIVGSMWNGVETPPAGDVFGNEYQNNDIKRIATKSGNRLVMDDKQGKEAIVLGTPHHVRVSLFDGGSQLLLHSDGDIHINAGGTVHMKCAQFLREIG